jgi:hypothetical protein
MQGPDHPFDFADIPMRSDRVKGRKVPGWDPTGNGKAIRRTYEFLNFRAAIAFVAYVAELAEAADPAEPASPPRELSCRGAARHCRSEVATMRASRIRASIGFLASGTLTFLVAFPISTAPAIALESLPPISEEESLAAVDEPDGGSRLHIGLRLSYLQVKELHGGDINAGVVAGFRLGPRLTLEASYDSQLGGAFSGIVLGRDFTVDALQATLVWYPSSRRARFRPFVMGGAGYYTSQYENWSWSSSEGWVSTRVSGQSDSGFHSGAGLELSSRRDSPLALVADARWLYTRKDEADPGRVAPDGLLVSVGLKVQMPKWALGES